MCRIFFFQRKTLLARAFFDGAVPFPRAPCSLATSTTMHSFDGSTVVNRLPNVSPLFFSHGYRNRRREPEETRPPATGAPRLPSPPPPPGSTSGTRRASRGPRRRRRRWSSFTAERLPVAGADRRTRGELAGACVCGVPVCVCVCQSRGTVWVCFFQYIA